MTTLKNRYDFVYIFDVKDGNPNGDPDAGNLPRVDAETGQGIITDVCLKRKVRNYVELVKEAKPPYDIFIKERAVLNQTIENAFIKVGLSEEKQKEYDEKIKSLKEDLKKEKDKNKIETLKKEIDSIKESLNADKARKYLTDNYYDIRTFGAVMATGMNAGQVRGPVQFTFGRSVSPIVSLEHSITRMAVTTEKEAEDQKGDNRTMGRKSTVPYGLYVAYGFISAPLAKQTGFSQEDLDLFWKALINMFENDRSAARGLMSARKLYVFEHSDELGSAPASKLFDLIKIQKKDENIPARDFSDYSITVGQTPSGVTLEEKI
ncbi:MAG: type I-C CRISPR-associated protein Cas7/Csd2 [Syntrophomonadaceae bacterium]|jgi:CRISPR-associated protein Csd2|nr:type I-C CRISPR-associated protein Cas7/Csd2 [Syntrophomonadaceae bacterium]